jgi:hypothetical protein
MNGSLLKLTESECALGKRGGAAADGGFDRGSLVVWSLKADLLAAHMVARLAVVTITYGIVFLVVIRLIFWHSLASLLSYIPGEPRLRRVLVVSVVTAFTVGPS